MKASATLLTFAAAAGLASAQTLSTDCMNSFKAVIASPDAACLNPGPLLSLFVNQQSIPDTINNWISGLCSTGFCSNDTLATVVTNITTGCQSDFGIAGGVPDTVVQIVQEVYPTARSIMCLKDDSTNQLCVTETLTNIEDIVGKLSFSNFNIATSFASFQNVLVSAKNLACTGCTKAAFRLASQLSLVTQFPGAQQQAADQIDAICGANFIENSTSDSGDNVSQTAINEAFTTQKNGALAMTTSKVAGGLMLFFFSAFTLLG